MAQENGNTFKWRSLIGLVIIYLAVWFNWSWIWGVLFILWVIPDLISGITYFMEPVDKRSNPVLYWAIVITWIVLSLLIIATYFVPGWEQYQ